jgi:ribonucrease Y
MQIYMYILLGAAIGFFAFFSGWLLNARMGKNRILNAEDRAKRILEDAEKESANLKKEKILEAKDEWYKRKK